MPIKKTNSTEREWHAARGGSKVFVFKRFTYSSNLSKEGLDLEMRHLAKVRSGQGQLDPRFERVDPEKNWGIVREKVSKIHNVTKYLRE